LQARQGAPKLTATRLATLPAGDHTDPATSGLQLRVRPTASGASRTWLFRYTWRSEWVRIVIGHFPSMPLADARARAQEMRRAIDEGIDPRRARPRRRQMAQKVAPGADTSSADKHSVEHLVSEFIARYLRPHRKTPEWAEGILNRDVLPKWKGRDARTITPSEVIERLDEIVDRGAPVLANRTASLLGQLFRFGIHRRIVEQNPVQLLMRPGGKEKPRERTLTDEELHDFLSNPKACTRYERLAHVVLVLLLTGQRRGELALARWSDVDLQARTWNIPDENSKTGRGHIVPLSDWAVEEFAALKREAERSPWVLPGPDPAAHVEPKQLSRSLAKCLERFQKRGIAAFTLHDLRRTCRTGLSRLKVEPHIAERVLNHVQPGVAGVYDRHAYLTEKRDALEKWAAHLAALRGPESAS